MNKSLFLPPTHCLTFSVVTWKAGSTTGPFSEVQFLDLLKSEKMVDFLKRRGYDAYIRVSSEPRNRGSLEVVA